MLAKSIRNHSSSFSSSLAPPRNYDVFLSFRCEDTTGENFTVFTDYLYTALVEAGIHTFKFRDVDGLERGKEISVQVIKAIQESRISIVVFSKHYASSGSCLDELVKILECRDTTGQLVLPIFYDVDPSDVRKQTGSIAKAFTRHEQRFKAEAEMDRVGKWRKALTGAANLSGWDLQNLSDGPESKFIQKIVNEVLRKVNHTDLDVAKHPIGIYSRVEDINLLLSIGTDDVRMIGIFGMAGIGKTAIAKAVYNMIFHHFEGSCFLGNVGEVSGSPDGLVRLQEQLLSETVMQKDLKIGNVDRGIKLMRERLLSKRVLIVLDDLDKLSQANSLIGNCNWFGSGSRIVITTRDEHLLNELKVSKKYEVKELNLLESLQLFSWHAFGEASPSEDYAKLSKDIVSYVGGLPLALEVLGSYLFRRNLIEWKSAFEKLQQIPHNQIQKKLRLCFDALEDDKLKAIFLDIACFFIGMDKDCTVNILNSCGFSAESGIGFLTSRCLLTINERNEVRMHDLLRDMGREIIRQESTKEPGKRSRLWFHEDVCDVLENQKGTETIEGVTLHLPTSNEVHLNTKAFARMHKLRLLQIKCVHLTGSFENVSKELRWLYWHNCSLRYLPSNFHLENLVVLDLQHSNMKKVWQDFKFVRNLKVLNLSHSNSLTKTPDFTGLPRLEKLLLEGCTSLFDVHPSIGVLDRLVFLNLKDCKNIGNLPNSICQLKSLEYLNLTGCSILQGLPEHLGNMDGLKELLAFGTAIKQLPFSFGHLKKLEIFTLRGCSNELPAKSWLSHIPSWVQTRSCPNSLRFLPPSISGLCSLRRLVLIACNLSERDIPVDLGSLASLEYLSLDRNNFYSLPSSLSHLSKLHFLGLDECRSLQSVPELPPNLRSLYANDCTSLEKLSNLSNFKRAPSLFLSHCKRLAEIQGLENLDSIGTIRIEGCNKLANTIKDSFFEKLSDEYEACVCLPLKEIPDWFSYQRMGSSISFDMPLHVDHQFLGMALWVVYAAVENRDEWFVPPAVAICDRTNGVDWTYKPTTTGIQVTCHEHSWVCRIPKSYFKYPLKGGERINAWINMEEPFEVKKCGIHLVYKPEITGHDQVQSSSANTNGQDELMDIMHPKRGRDVSEVGTSNDWFQEDKVPKRLRMEPDQTKDTT